MIKHSAFINEPYYVVRTDRAQRYIDIAIRDVKISPISAIANALIALAILHCPEETNP